MERTVVEQTAIDKAIGFVVGNMEAQLERKGHGGFTSEHETLGVVQEEMHEVHDAIRDGDPEHIKCELADVAVAAIWGIASMLQEQENQEYEE